MASFLDSYMLAPIPEGTAESRFFPPPNNADSSLTKNALPWTVKTTKDFMPDKKFTESMVYASTSVYFLDNNGKRLDQPATFPLKYTRRKPLENVRLMDGKSPAYIQVFTSSLAETGLHTYATPDDQSELKMTYAQMPITKTKKVEITIAPYFANWSLGNPKVEIYLPIIKTYEGDKTYVNSSALSFTARTDIVDGKPTLVHTCETKKIPIPQ